LREFLIAAVAALTALAVVAVAQAQPSPGAEVTVSISPSKVGTKKKPKPEKITLEVKNEDSSQTADGLEVFIAKNLKVSTKGLKKCSAARLEAEGKSACPAASKVGSGTADAIAGVNTGAPAALKFNVTAFIIGNNKVGFYLEQQGGEIRVMATGTFKRASGQYGSVLDVDIPQLAREFPPGTFNGLVGLKTTLYKKIGKNALLKSNGCPSTRQLPFKVVIHFMNNPNPPKAEEVEATGTANCRR
jgi:methionine-rich copper-binding protein CopC